MHIAFPSVCQLRPPANPPFAPTNTENTQPHQAAGEQNFHILYYLFSHPKAAELQLTSVLDFGCDMSSRPTARTTVHCKRCNAQPLTLSPQLHVATFPLWKWRMSRRCSKKSMRLSRCGTLFCRRKRSPHELRQRPSDFSLRACSCQLSILALQVVGFSEEESFGCYQVLAAILHLGNINFEAPVGWRGRPTASHFYPHEQPYFLIYSIYPHILCPE